MTLFSQKFQDASRWFLYHFQATCIVGEGNMGKLDLLLAILKQEKKSIVLMFSYPYIVSKIPRYVLCFDMHSLSEAKWTYNLLLKGKYVMVEKLV